MEPHKFSILFELALLLCFCLVDMSHTDPSLACSRVVGPIPTQFLLSTSSGSGVDVYEL